MDQAPQAPPVKAPGHLWIVGTLALLWSAMGCLDYLMAETRNEDYMAGFSQELIDFTYATPSWQVAVWAIGVWGGLFGSLFLLLRRRAAIPLLTASLLASVISTVANFGFRGAMDVMGDAFSLALTAAIIILGIVFVAYARAMSRRGVLR